MVYGGDVVWGEGDDVRRIEVWSTVLPVHEFINCLFCGR